MMVRGETMDFGDKTIYCKNCKKERWVGAKCSAHGVDRCDDAKTLKDTSKKGFVRTSDTSLIRSLGFRYLQD